MVLLALVLGSAAAADKQSSDTVETFKVLRRSYMAMDVSRPRLEKIAKLLDKITMLRKGSKNDPFVNNLKARKLNNLFMRYLQEKARKGYLREKETAVSRASQFKLRNNLFVRYLREYERAAIIQQSVIQALDNKKGAQKKSSDTVDSRIWFVGPLFLG